MERNYPRAGTPVASTPSAPDSSSSTSRSILSSERSSNQRQQPGEMRRSSHGGSLSSRNSSSSSNELSQSSTGAQHPASTQTRTVLSAERQAQRPGFEARNEQLRFDISQHPPHGDEEPTATLRGWQARRSQARTRFQGPDDQRRPYMTQGNGSNTSTRIPRPPSQPRSGIENRRLDRSNRPSTSSSIDTISDLESEGSARRETMTRIAATTPPSRVEPPPAAHPMSRVGRLPARRQISGSPRRVERSPASSAQSISARLWVPNLSVGTESPTATQSASSQERRTPHESPSRQRRHQYQHSSARVTPRINETPTSSESRVQRQQEAQTPPSAAGRQAQDQGPVEITTAVGPNGGGHSTSERTRPQQRQQPRQQWRQRRQQRGASRYLALKDIECTECQESDPARERVSCVRCSGSMAARRLCVPFTLLASLGQSVANICWSCTMRRTSQEQQGRQQQQQVRTGSSPSNPRNSPAQPISERHSRCHESYRSVLQQNTAATCLNCTSSNRSSGGATAEEEPTNPPRNCVGCGRAFCGILFAPPTPSWLDA